MKFKAPKKYFLSSLLLSASFVLLPSLALASYQPGQTLDPSCPPTDPTCIVVPSTASSTNISASFQATSTTATSTFAGSVLVAGTASSTNLVVSNSLTLGGLNGILKAVAGVVTTALVNLSTDVTGILGISNGGTGTTTAPTYGQVLVGNASGGYALLATSSLGIAGASNYWTASGGNIFNNTGTNVGIGTTSPWAVLSIAGSAGGTTPLFAISTSTAGFASSTAFFIDQNGNVGIGTNSPSATLAVNGSGYFSGSLTASNMSPSPAVIRQELNPSIDLAKLEASATPTVCVIGDSTVSQADYITSSDSQWTKLQSALVARYPNKTFTFKDFSIGGRSLGDFTTVLSSGWPSWYTNHSATWNSYVASAGCTSLFISFGLNDTGYESAGVFATARTQPYRTSFFLQILWQTRRRALRSAPPPTRWDTWAMLPSSATLL
jgi:hypothetical protein